MRIRFSIVVIALTMASPAAVAAQLPLPLTLGGRVGVAVPQGELTSSEDGFGAGAGPAFTLDARLDVLGGVGVFVQYGQARFGCDDCEVLGLDERVLLESIGGGVRLAIPLSGGGLAPWVEAGLVQQTIGFSADRDTFASEADVGFAAGAGVSLPFASRFELAPGIRYMTIPAEFDFTALPDREISGAAVIIDLGIAIRL